MLSVHLVTVHCAGRVGSCSHVRWLLPLRYPSNTNYFAVTHGTGYSRADVVVVERTWTEDMALARDLVERARADGATLVYTTDDNVLDLRIEGPVARWLSPAHQDVVRYLAAEADGVIVSTPPLAEQMSAFNRRVVVLPNALDERLFGNRLFAAGRGDARLDPGAPLVIGYMGTATHDDDLLSIAPVLRQVLAENGGRVELQVVGAVARPETLKAFEGLPVRVLQSGHDVQYPEFVRRMAAELRWDLAIAPLRDDAFTRAKSDIKALDYAGLGIPAVFAAVRPYAETVRHLETGYVAGDDPAEWLDGLRRLVGDAALRARLAANAREYLMSCRVLRRRAGDWREAIESVRRVANTAAVPFDVPAAIARPTPPPRPPTVLVVVPGSVNYFYDRAGARLAEVMRPLGVSCDVATLAEAETDAFGGGSPLEWCFFVNPYEIAAGYGDQADAVRRLRGVMRRCRRGVAVALECAQTPWFMHSVRLCREAGIDTLLDLGFHSQRDELPQDVSANYRFIFNGLTASERRAVPAQPDEAARPIPWVLVGHQSAERSALAYRLIQEAQPDGFVYLPRLSPVTENGPHLNERQFRQVLSRARCQVWCAHHPHFYMESERFRDSLLTGSLPVKVVERLPDGRQVYPFEGLLVATEDLPAWLRRSDYATMWRRYRDEFLALPMLEEGMAAFLDLPAPASSPSTVPANAAAESVAPARATRRVENRGAERTQPPGAAEGRPGKAPERPARRQKVLD